jgi:hypothetical protein
MTAPDAAAALGLAAITIRRRAQDGHIPGAHKPGRDWMIPVAWVEQERARQDAGDPNAIKRRNRKRRSE